MGKRQFRGQESLEAERSTWQMLPGFLTERGFTNVVSREERRGLTISAVSPDRKRLEMRVRLCWRRVEDSRDSERMRTYSAAQLLSKISNGDWIGSLDEKMSREESHGITHLLLIQRDKDFIRYAALVPLSEVIPIWTSQRDISERLIRDGHTQGRTKNHAMNGSSPTLWLQDDRGGQDVATALWGHPGVVDLVSLPKGLKDTEAEEDDEFEPTAGDRRPIIHKQIRARRGQKAFRDRLCKRYDSRCLVTGCEVLDVLEAAHISPYRGKEDNHAENGLLLRSDIHTLFDLDLLGITPDELRIELHPKVKESKEYKGLEGLALNCSKGKRPSAAALKLRYEEFQKGEK